MDHRISRESYRYYLDALRVLASFLVCYNHSFIFGLYVSRPMDGSVRMWTNIFQSVPATVNVPLFFMISGALLLGREDSYKTLLTKRVFRFVVLLFAANAVVWLIKRPDALTLGNYLTAVISGNVQLTYWYLYAYLSYLLMLPFLRKIAVQLRGQDVCLLLALRGLFSVVLPVTNFWLEEPISIATQLSGGIACMDMLYYPLVGWYLANRLPLEKLGRKQIAACWAVFLVGTALSAGMVYAQGVREEASQRYLTLFSWSSAPAVFLIVRSWLDGRELPQRLGNWLKTISSLTLGIYLLEPVAHEYLKTAHYWNMKWEGTWENLEVGWYSVTWCLVCMTAGGLTTWLLRKIPGVKKFL